MARTPLYVIGGSLGSGKTTLLQRLLSGEHGRLAVLVNEFGEIGIDGSLISGRNVDMIELTGGCVCCSLTGEFEAAVRELIATFGPDAIVVETTGVAEADALVDNIETDLDEVRLEAVVVLLDADIAMRFPDFGYVERNQLAAADIVLVNKADLVTPDVTDALCARVRELNGHARILVTVHAAVEPALIFASGVHMRTGAPEAHSAPHGHGFTSFSWRPSGSLRRDCFEHAVAGWPHAVFRAKGRVRCNGERVVFNYVAGRMTIEPAAGEGDDALVWIGPEVERHRDAIIAALEDCLDS